jgi:hypothetical protein
MRRMFALTWLIAAVLGSLVPLAYASPPDPTYLAGIWDNADYDDVVTFVASSLDSTDTDKIDDPIRPLIGVPLVLPTEETLSPAVFSSLHCPRGPPAA